MSFPGITNSNEFFTNYYFEEVFPSEIKEHLAKHIIKLLSNPKE